MDFIPSAPILTSLVAALALPLVLAALSHGPWKVAAAGRRFLVAATLTAAGWGVSLLPAERGTAADVVAGAFILLAAGLAEFTLWTLIAWGFTTSLLRTLARENRPVSLEEWVAAYTGGRAADAFAQDRLGILFRFGMAFRENGRVLMTPRRGLRTARLAWALRRVFGLNP
jgi:hypothetical protein